MPAFKMVKSFSYPPISNQMCSYVPNGMSIAQKNLQARRKLTKILRSKASKEIPLSVGQLVEIYMKKDKDKRGFWSATQAVLSVDYSELSITVPGKNGQPKPVGFEDIRTDLPKDCFSTNIQESIGNLDDIIQDLIQSPVV